MTRPSVARSVPLAAALLAALTAIAVRAESPPKAPPADEKLERFEFTQPQMGVPFTIAFYAPSQEAAEAAARAAFVRIKELNGILSDYDAESELSRLSATAGKGTPVAVSDELWKVLTAGQDLAERSNGAFDVSIGPVTRLWRRARRAKQLPEAEKVAMARDLTGFRRLRLMEGGRKVELTTAGMQLDLGGIAKGYAADEAIRTLAGLGIRRALVAASGDIVAGDPPPDAVGWKVGVAPLEKDAEPTRFLLLANAAVSTSGDLWQYLEVDGVRYSHIVDPRTGMGLTERVSATVVAPRGIDADALATAVCVLGTERGLALINAAPHTAALVVREQNGKTVERESDAWNKLKFAR